ncbi:MAG: serine/threonine protein kinase [Kiritimatiellae bacterium]|nr:serine/threonine protein kinase [Kiritimatiellia bacterium]
MSATPDFDVLTPDAVVTAVEAALDVRLEPCTQPLPSYVNRVYGLRSEEGQSLVAKFYRPGRWSCDALRDEHSFVQECHAEEIPVIAPLTLRHGDTLGLHDGISFSVYPRRGGRPFDTDGADAWTRIGSLLGRVHRVGARHAAEHRRDLHPDAATREDLDYLTAGAFLPAAERQGLVALGEKLLETIGPLFDDVTPIRLHGDCQRTNVLERPGEGLQLIDFDDMVNGPAVQDIWLLLPDAPDRCAGEIERLISAYEVFLPFDRGSLRLIEPLRAMRMIHYLAWCARQSGDYAFHGTHPDWGTRSFWQTELAGIEEQLATVQHP